MGCYKIAGKIIDLIIPIEYLSKEFQDFTYSGKDTADISFKMADFDETGKKRSMVDSDGIFLFRTEQMSVAKKENQLVIFYKDNSPVRKNVIDTKSWRVEIFIEQKNTVKAITDAVFIAIRDSFFTYLAFSGYMCIHSSSIIYRENAYLFSASAGVGKTTHTNMWEKLFRVPILNGDVTVIGLENDKPVAYGIPWCGTSNRYLNQRSFLGGIIFLERGSQNRIEDLSNTEALKRLIARSFNPNWNEELLELSFETAQKMIGTFKSYKLTCTPNEEAVLITAEKLRGK